MAIFRSPRSARSRASRSDDTTSSNTSGGVAGLRDLLDQRGDRLVEGGVAGAVAGELQRSSSERRQVGERRLGPGAEVADHLGGRQRAEAARGPEVVAVGEPEQEAGGEEVAGAGGVDDALDRAGVDHVHLVAGDDHRALLAAGERRDLALARHLLQGVVERVDPVERRDLVLVREQDVDVVLEQVEELVAVALDAERVGEGERHAVAGVVRGAGGPAERVLGVGLVPEVALEEQHLRAGEEGGVELGRARAGRRRRGTC